MKTPPGLEIIESCMGCPASRQGFFCRFSPQVLRSVDEVSHHTAMPAGALLFVEGQSPRGIFLICSGSVRLSAGSREGKVLILKEARAGDVIGLGAVISGTSYEMTAEAATHCQLNFIGRRDLMTLLYSDSELSAKIAIWLSHEFQDAYRDIHDLVLSGSCSSKVARLLLSYTPTRQGKEEQYLPAIMTHEEMAQRIGAARETVTRSMTEFRKKNLIRFDGDIVVIRNRPALEALAM